MSERPSFDEIFMDWARGLARRSTCSRAQVGCLIVTDDNHSVLSMGYNGGAKGLFNECLSDEPGQCGHLHAEINALIKLDYNEPSVKRLYSTTAPCFSCAVAIVNANVQQVVYETEYRDRRGLDLLKDAQILVRQMGK